MLPQCTYIRIYIYTNKRLYTALGDEYYICIYIYRIVLCAYWSACTAYTLQREKSINGRNRNDRCGVGGDCSLFFFFSPNVYAICPPPPPGRGYAAKWEKPLIRFLFLFFCSQTSCLGSGCVRFTAVCAQHTIRFGRGIFRTVRVMAFYLVWGGGGAGRERKKKLGFWPETDCVPFFFNFFSRKRYFGTNIHKQVHDIPEIYRINRVVTTPRDLKQFACFFFFFLSRSKHS